NCSRERKREPRRITSPNAHPQLAVRTTFSHLGCLTHAVLDAANRSSAVRGKRVAGVVSASEMVRRCLRVDLDAGHGAALGRILRGSSTDIPLTTRLRSLLTRSASDDDPVGQLVRTHRSIHPSADTSILRRGYAIAESMHRGQYRKSGDPYITHPLAVAQICAELGMDTTTLVAALLHDTVEDTRYTLQALQADFGPEVAHLVDGVTKFDKEFYGKAAEAETIRKMIIAAGKDVR